MGTNFLLFTSQCFESSGGMGDCQGQFATLQDATDFAIQKCSSFDDDKHVLEIGDTLTVHVLNPDTGVVEKSTPLETLIGEKL